MNGMSATKNTVRSLSDHRSERLQEIKDIVDSNLKSIRDLIKQAEDLSNIIENTNDDNVKKVLEKNQDAVLKSLDVLVDNTDKFFSAYFEILNSYTVPRR